jgi:hypothetical protein
MRSRRGRRLAILALTGCVVWPACSDDASSPTGPSGTAGATPVRGTERMAWAQVGDTSRLRFRAYVDDRPVDLPGAICTGSATQADCGSPLPPLSNGVHTIAVVNVMIATGVESERTNAITVQKVSASAASRLASLPSAVAAPGMMRLETVVTIGDASFTADIVATGVRAPAQMTSLSDGRLLVAEGSERVRMVRPGEPAARESALDAGALSSASVGAMGIASHPDFTQNHLVYLALLERDGALMRLRLLRLREVGDRLGEFATLFDAPVAGDAALSEAGPRMAFGPDRLLYVMLPPGLEFVNEPAASTPRAAMLRLTDDGRVPPGEQLSGVTASPLGFAWHGDTSALWVMFRGENGEATVRSLGGRNRVQPLSAQAPKLLAREGTGAAAGTLLVQPTRDDLLAAHALSGARLALPARNWVDGMADRVSDVVAGDRGTLFVATSNGLVDGIASDVVVRLKPVPATARTQTSCCEASPRPR